MHRGAETPCPVHLPCFESGLLTTCDVSVHNVYSVVDLSCSAQHQSVVGNRAHGRGW
jgi:hypothetical protein